MATTMDRLDALLAPAGSARGRAQPVLAGATVLASGVAVAAAIAGLASATRVTPLVTAVAAIVIAGAGASLAQAWIRPRELAAPLTGSLAAIGGVALLATAHAGDASSARELTRALAIALLPAAGLHLVLGLPDGRLQTRARRSLAIATYLGAVVIGLSTREQFADLTLAVWLLALLSGGCGAAGFADRCRRSNAIDRARLQWAGWGAVVAAVAALVVWGVEALLTWPRQPAAIAVAVVALVPLSLVLGASDRLALRIDRLLVHTIVASGVALMVGAVYLLVVLGLGNAPANDDERAILGLSMVAAALGAVLAGPARQRLDEIAHERVYGERRSPEEALETFGSRMSRAVPMDELLLQLAESLKKSMQLTAAEVWTGSDGVFELAASVPDRSAPRIALSNDELPVVARARVSGNAWLQVWVPALLAGREQRLVQVAPVAHSGGLLGLVVVERAADATPFGDDEVRVLTELARQVGLALHNLQLDTALQASLAALQQRAEELRASRARIVAAADQSRRKIERNLHDGAQQHLVALAVKLGLARQVIDTDPAAAAALLEELRQDAQATLTELRELAHGIYPPLLMDRGLPEALRAAANRAVLATDVVADVGRYPPETEAAAYFCCLEAMQNAGKHAGAGARIAITVTEEGGELQFEVADDGLGFDVPSSGIEGHGFINMSDRLGAIGGTLTIDSEPGRGTRIVGTIPVSS